MFLLLHLFIPWVPSQSPTGRASFSDSFQPESLAPCTLAVRVCELSTIHVSVLLFKSTFVLLWQIQYIPLKAPTEFTVTICHYVFSPSDYYKFNHYWVEGGLRIFFWHLKWALVVTQVGNYCPMGYMGAMGVAPSSLALSFLVCQMEVRYNCLFF